MKPDTFIMLPPALPYGMNSYPEKPVNLRIVIKVVESKYLEDFLNGNLYMKPFKDFRSVEEKIARGDELEGVDATYRSEDIKLQMSKKDGSFLPINGLVGRGNFHNIYEKNTNLFSCSGFSLDDLIIGDSKFTLNKKFRDFGDKCVLVFDVPEFLLMIQKGFEKARNIIQVPNEPLYFRHIDYVSPTYNGRWGAFRKINTYEWQQELRIAIYRNCTTKKPKPYKLHIGSLRHISNIYDTEKLIIDGLNVNFSGIR